jgi:hypothetical protein
VNPAASSALVLAAMSRATVLVFIGAKMLLIDIYKSHPRTQP